MFHFFRSYDIIVRKLPEKEIPRRSPKNFTTDDIKEGVDGLYIAIRGKGAPRSDDEVVIGNNQKRANGTTLPGKLIYSLKLGQKSSFSKIIITHQVKIIKNTKSTLSILFRNLNFLVKQMFYF